MARAGHAAESALAESLAEETSRLADELAPQELATLQWACAQAGSNTALLQLPEYEQQHTGELPELTNPLELKVAALEDELNERGEPPTGSNGLAAHGDVDAEHSQMACETTHVAWLVLGFL